MNIPIFRLEFEKEFIEKYKKGSEEIFLSGRPIGENKYVGLFEKKFARLVDAKYAIAVANGTAALELALKAVNVKGKKVIIPANTFFATAIAVTNAGAANELVDVEDENFAIDPNQLERLIIGLRKNKEEIGAVVIVHVGGIISKNIKKIVKICKANKIPLIEDAAQAHFSKFENFKAGTIGDIGAFSFFPTKVMTTGEGGMITTNNKNYYEKLRSLKNFGRDNDNIEICINPDGNNYKVSEFTGLLGILECDRVKKRIKIRNDYTKIYAKRLKDSSFIPVLQANGNSSQYKMILKTKIDREWLRKYCRENNITLTGEVWKTPIHKQPLYKKMFKDKSFPVTDDISRNHICPPLYPELTVKEVNYICDVLLRAEKVYEKQNS
jgi:perosamine synthetase